MSTLLTTLIVLVAILLIIVILLQEPKEGGVSANLSAVSQFGGVQKTTDFLEKASWLLFAALIILSVIKVGIDKPEQIYPSELPQPTEQTQ